MKATTLKDLLWVVVQLILLAGLLLAPAFGLLPYLASLRPLGLLISVIGLGISGVATWQLRAGSSLTPMPSPRAGATLLTSGLYRHVRHPVYSGLLVWAFGIAIAATSLLHFVLFALLWIFFTAKAAHEERMLYQKFGNYAEYAARTPLFIPTPTHQP